MKRGYKLLITLVSFGFLASCSSPTSSAAASSVASSAAISSEASSLISSLSISSQEPDYDEYTGYKMADDPSENYGIDTTISNENSTVNYEIFVRSFYDTDGNGIGDLNGVKAKLPYLKSMGFKTLWLMPIFPSPTYHGYDVTDYYRINSAFGSMDDFESLVNEAKNYNIDIMLDMVLNHCSTKSDYFKQSKEDYLKEKQGLVVENSKADWINWKDDSATNYEASFAGGMADFNLDSEGVRAEFENICKFWIGKGVKGFRLDAVLYYYNNTSKNVAFLNWLEDTCHKYDENFYMVGECWTSDAVLNSYANSKCDSFFRFGNSLNGEYNPINLLKERTKSSLYAEYIEKNEKIAKSNRSTFYSSYFLSNHDEDRPSKSLDGDKYKAALSLNYLMPGTPYMYYGEEIAMKGQRKTAPDDYSDVKRRLPMIWSSSSKTGQCNFPESGREDLDTTVQVTQGVEDLEKDPFSYLNHAKKVINIRNKYSKLFKEGVFTSMVSSLKTEERPLMAYKIANGEDYLIVVHNFSSKNAEVSSPGSEIVESINTNHKIPSLKDGKLRIGACSTVIMR